MDNLKMLEMALNQLKQYSSNEWVENENGERYNIDVVLSQIKDEPEPFSSKSKLHSKTGIFSTGYIHSDSITHIGGVAVNWTFHTTDNDCEFEDG